MEQHRRKISANLMIGNRFRYHTGERPPYITSGIDLSRYPPPPGSVPHMSQPDNSHSQEMLKFVRKSEIDNARYMAEQVRLL